MNMCVSANRGEDSDLFFSSYNIDMKIILTNYLEEIYFRQTNIMSFIFILD